MCPRQPLDTRTAFRARIPPRGEVGSRPPWRVSVNEASAVLRAAVRDTIRKRSLLFLIQGGGDGSGRVLALIFPAFMSTGLLSLLGWLLILSGIVQIVSLIGATQVPYFWLQLVTRGTGDAGGLPARHAIPRPGWWR